jgi:hypothetical protein
MFSAVSLQTTTQKFHADLISLPFEKGVISKLKTLTPSGMSFNCFLFQAEIGEFSPQLI